MPDNDEKVLPVLRLLLVAFFGLLFVLALQLFLLVTHAHASTTCIRVGYSHLNDGQTPLWNVPENRIDRQYGIATHLVDKLTGGGVTYSVSVSGSVEPEFHS